MNSVWTLLNTKQQEHLKTLAHGGANLGRGIKAEHNGRVWFVHKKDFGGVGEDALLDKLLRIVEDAELDSEKCSFWYCPAGNSMHSIDFDFTLKFNLQKLMQ